MTFKQKVKQRTTREILNILMQPKVRQKGTEFVVDILKQPETKTAVIVLLQNVMQDRRFINHSTMWATDLLTRVVLGDSVIK